MKYTSYEVDSFEGKIKVFDHCKIIKKVNLKKFIKDGLYRIYGLEKESPEMRQKLDYIKQICGKCGKPMKIVASCEHHTVWSCCDSTLTLYNQEDK